MIEAAPAAPAGPRVGCNRGQLEALIDTKSILMVANTGKGFGKTFLLCEWALNRSSQNPASCMGMLIEPTYPMVQSVLLPELRKAFKRWGVVPQYNKSERCMVWSPEQRVIWIRSAEHPERLDGPTLAFVGGDEAAQMDEEAYERLTSRIRDENAKILQALWVGTPEGTHTWVERLKQEILRNPVVVIDGVELHRRFIHGTTHDNRRHLDRRSLATLEMIASGDQAFIQQYIMGIATDAGGNIYGAVGQENIQVFAPPAHGDIVLGWDFNIDFMVTPVGVWDKDKKRLHIIGEFISTAHMYDEMKGHPGIRQVGLDGAMTDEHADWVATELVRRGLARRGRTNFGAPAVLGRNGNPVLAFIDATAASRNRTKTPDRAAVAAAGFIPRHDARNPYVENRVFATRYAIRRGRLVFCPRGAPISLRSIQGHGRDKNRKPQKTFGAKDLPLDHPADAVGYPTWGLMPVRSVARGTGWSAAA